MMNLNILKCLVAGAVLALSACHGSNEWTVDGRIDGADGKTMVVEACDNGRWYPIDSVTLDGAGRFSISHPAAGYPDIYRLRLGDKMLYFPIDSIETVTVVSKASAFDSDYTIEGSPSAERLMAVDRRLRDAMSRGGIVGDTLLKRELGNMLISDPANIVSYYIINKRIGGVQLFNPGDRADLRIIGAVANAFDQMRPNDPRTAYLRSLYLNNRRQSRAAAPGDTMHVREIDIFDMKLYDARGVLHSLADVASKGDVTVLNFTDYSAEQSPSFNRELNKVWERHRADGLQIYQVSVEADEYQWRQAAKVLPWIAVYNPATTEGARNLMNYNVTEVPVIYLFNRRGELVRRVDNISALEREVSQLL